MLLKSRGLLTLLLSVVLMACTTEPTRAPVKLPTDTTNLSISTAAFPSPPELQPQVDFWRKVYGVWGRDQVALHDDRYMDIIYGVVTLPGSVSEGQSAEQKGFYQGAL